MEQRVESMGHRAWGRVHGAERRGCRVEGEEQHIIRAFVAKTRTRNKEQNYKHMKAFIFAAGKGTRLRPFTLNKPKALVEILGKPLIMHTMEALQQAGADHMIINIHHLGEQIIEFLEKTPLPGIRVSISDERSHLLDTGGALKKAAHMLQDNQPFFAVNADVVTNLDLKALMKYHNKHKPLATMAVKKRKSSRYLLINHNNQLTGWKNSHTGEQIIAGGTENKNLHEAAFSGIQVIHPEIFKHLPREEAFPIIPWYLSLAKRHTLLTWNHDHSFWFDVGTPEKLNQARQHLKKINAP